MTRTVMLLPLLIAGLATSVMAASSIVSPEEAIAAAVARHLGVAAEVTVTALQTKVGGAAGLLAEPDARARVARPSRFILTIAGERQGTAVATVTVVARYPRAARAIARDTTLEIADVEMPASEVPPVAMRPVLSGTNLVGLVARRPIMAGEPLTAAVLQVPPDVRNGDPVQVTVRIGRVQVSGAGRASGSGMVGEMIRVLPPGSVRSIAARITGPGMVEIVQ